MKEKRLSGHENVEEVKPVKESLRGKRKKTAKCRRNRGQRALRGGGAAARPRTGGHRDRGDDPARVTPKPAERPRREVPACGAALPRGPIWRDEESSSVRRQGEAALFF